MGRAVVYVRERGECEREFQWFSTPYRRCAGGDGDSYGGPSEVSDRLAVGVAEDRNVVGPLLRTGMAPPGTRPLSNPLSPSRFLHNPHVSARFPPPYSFEIVTSQVRMQSGRIRCIFSEYEVVTHGGGRWALGSDVNGGRGGKRGRQKRNAGQKDVINWGSALRVKCRPI